jgi:hypothetical protein
MLLPEGVHDLMVYQRNINQPPEVKGPWCIHLRSKGMYVRQDFNTTDRYEADSGHYWCIVNQHVFGPDNVEVGRETCIPGRACYCDTVGQWPKNRYPTLDDEETDADESPSVTLAEANEVDSPPESAYAR